jgi:hypothetical protein
MKPWRDHHRREAWIMALLLPAIVIIGTIAGFIMPWLHRVFWSH